MLTSEISKTLGGQATLNHNGVRLFLRHGRKGSVEFLIGSAQRDRLHLDPGKTSGNFNMLEDQLREQCIRRVL